MMDYVELIKEVKTKYGAEDKAVIVFGGSYGGMLASWIRMKYPHVFQGALAASAPILYFKDAPSAPEDAFSMIASNDFAETYSD
jgi:lysosomal Pro-X carboxypeptidase